MSFQVMFGGESHRFESVCVSPVLAPRSGDNLKKGLLPTKVNLLLSTLAISPSSLPRACLLAFFNGEVCMAVTEAVGEQSAVLTLTLTCKSWRSLARTG